MPGGLKNAGRWQGWTEETARRIAAREWVAHFVTYVLVAAATAAVFAWGY